VGLTVQALSQTRSARRSVRRPAAQRKRTSGAQPAPDKTRSKQEIEQRRKDRRKEAQERADKEKAEFLHEKAALSPTPEQWEAIKPLLVKIRQLRGRPVSMTGVSLTSSTSGGRNGSRGRPVATWRWSKHWRGKPSSEWTEGQRTADELIDLVGNGRTSEEAFARKMQALRECRRQEAAKKKTDNIEAAIAKTQQQLRALLSTRQEAALVLMRWL